MTTPPEYDGYARDLDPGAFEVQGDRVIITDADLAAAVDSLKRQAEAGAGDAAPAVARDAARAEKLGVWIKR